MKLFLLTVLCIGLTSAGVVSRPEGRSSHFRSEDGAGNYAFGYEESHETGGSARSEKGDAAGNKVGSYSVTDADGRQRLVSYTADENGFRVAISSNEPGVKEGAPAGVIVAPLGSSPAIPAPLPTTPAPLSAPVQGVQGVQRVQTSVVKPAEVPVRPTASRVSGGRSLSFADDWSAQWAAGSQGWNRQYASPLFYSPQVSGFQTDRTVYQSVPTVGYAPVQSAAAVQTEVKKTEYSAPLSTPSGFAFSNQQAKAQFASAPVQPSGPVSSGAVSGQQQWTSTIVHEAQPVVGEKSWQSETVFKAPVVSSEQSSGSWQSGQSWKAPVAVTEKQQQSSSWQQQGQAAFYKPAEAPVAPVAPKSWESVSVVKAQSPSSYSFVGPQPSGQWFSGSPQLFYSPSPVPVQSGNWPVASGQLTYSTGQIVSPVSSWASSTSTDKSGWSNDSKQWASWSSGPIVAKSGEAEIASYGPTSFTTSIVHEAPKEVKQFA